MKNLNIGSCQFRKDGWINLDKPSAHYNNRQEKIDINYDLNSHNEIPISDEDLTSAYTSHTIEHIPDSSVEYLFKEVHRMLRIGGVFRITCPDIGRCYDAYMQNDIEYISGWLANPKGWKRFRSMGIGEQFLFIFASYLSPYLANTGFVRKYDEDEINNIFKTKTKEAALSYFTEECQRTAGHLQKSTPGNHISWWDFEKLKEKLQVIGFNNITKQEYNKSTFSFLEGFDCLSEANVSQSDYTLFIECIK